VAGLKVKPSSPTSTETVLLEEEALSVELAVGVFVVVVVLLASPPPPYWAATRGSQKRVNVHKFIWIIIIIKLDEKM
jgi:hypothetical protein